MRGKKKIGIIGSRKTRAYNSGIIGKNIVYGIEGWALIRVLAKRSHEIDIHLLW